MKKYFEKTFFVLLGIILIPAFVNAKTVSDLTPINVSCSAGTSVAKNTSATWSITGIGELVSPIISWSGSGVSGNSTTALSTYSTAGTISDVVVTIADETGSMEVACGSLKVNKTVSDLTPINVSCSAGTSVAKNTSATWSITGIDELVSPIITWSGSGVSGGDKTAISTYSIASTINDVVVTIADETGSMEVACSKLSITSSTSDDSTGGGSSSGGGSINRNTCNLIGNIDNDVACDADILDFNLLMLNWGSTVSGNRADLNKDGIVDILDFNILMLNWTGTL